MEKKKKKLKLSNGQILTNLQRDDRSPFPRKFMESLSPLTARVDWSRGKRRAMGREEQMNIGVNLLDNSLVLELSSIKMAHESFYRAHMHTKRRKFRAFVDSLTDEALNEI